MATIIKTVTGTAEAPVITPKASTSIFSDFVDALMHPLTGEDNELLTNSGSFRLMLAAGGIGAVAGGMYTRKRVANGQEAIAGFLF